MRMKSHGFGIDRYGIGVAGQVRQVAAMQAYGHWLPTSWNRSNANYRSIWKEASASGASCDKKIGGNLPAIAPSGAQPWAYPCQYKPAGVRLANRIGKRNRAAISRAGRSPWRCRPSTVWD